MICAKQAVTLARMILSVSTFNNNSISIQCMYKVPENRLRDDRMCPLFNCQKSSLRSNTLIRFHTISILHQQPTPHQGLNL